MAEDYLTRGVRIRGGDVEGATSSTYGLVEEQINDERLAFLGERESYFEELRIEQEAAEEARRQEALSIDPSEISELDTFLADDIDAKLQLAWRRSTGARYLTAKSWGIGASGDMSYRVTPEKQAELVEKYGINAAGHGYVDIMSMATSDEEADVAARLIQRNQRADLYAEYNMNGMWDFVEVGAMFLDPAFVAGSLVAGVATAPAKAASLVNATRTAAASGKSVRAARAGVYARYGAAESLAVDIPLEALRVTSQDELGMADFGINVALSGLAGYTLGSAATRLTFNEQKALANNVAIIKGKHALYGAARDGDTPARELNAAFDNEADFDILLSNRVADKTTTADDLITLHNELFPEAKPASGSKKKVAEQIRNQRRQELEQQRKDQIVHRETALEDLERAHGARWADIDPDDIGARAKKEQADAELEAAKAHASLDAALDAHFLSGRGTIPFRPPAIIGRNFGLQGGEQVARKQGFLAPGETVLARNEKLSEGFQGFKADMGAFYSLFYDSRGAYGHAQGSTIGLLSRLHKDVGAKFERQRNQAADNFWAVRGRYNKVTGGVSDELRNDFYDMVGAAHAGIKNLGALPVFKKHGINADEFLKSPEYRMAREAYIRDADDNRKALQDPDYQYQDVDRDPGQVALSQDGLNGRGDAAQARGPGETIDRDFKDITSTAEILGITPRINAYREAAKGARDAFLVSAAPAAIVTSGAYLLDLADAIEVSDEAMFWANTGLIAAATLAGGGRGMFRPRFVRQVAAERGRLTKKLPTVGILHGIDSPKADRGKLFTAMKMADDGVDRKIIWRETGWGKMPDGNWMFEDVVPYSEKFQDLEIPQEMLDALAKQGLDLRIEMPQGMDPTHLGSMQPTKGGAIIKINPDHPVHQRISTLVHEFQHVAQGADGRLETPFKDFNEYIRSINEVEARVAQHRLGMTAEQRRFVPPWEHFDVAEDDILRGALMKGGDYAERLRLTSAVSQVKGRYVDDNATYRGMLDNGKEAWDVELPDGDTIQFRLSPDGTDGQMEVEWDWIENVSDDLLEMEVRSKPAATQLQAFQVAAEMTRRVMDRADHGVLYFSGLTDAHAKRQKKLISQYLEGSDYVAYAGVTKGGSEHLVLIRNDRAGDAEDIVSSLHRSISKVDEIYRVDPRIIAASNPTPNRPYRGASYAEGWVQDRGYNHRMFDDEQVRNVTSNKASKEALIDEVADAVARSPDGRVKYAARLATVLGRAPSSDELVEAIRKGARMYVNALKDSRSTTKGEAGDLRFSPRTGSAIVQAKELLQRDLGRTLDDEEAAIIDAFQQILAPVKTDSNPGFAKQRMPMDLDAERHPNLISILDTNAHRSANTLRAQSAYHVGLLRKGIRDANIIEREYQRLKRAVDTLPTESERRIAARDVKHLRDIIDDTSMKSEGPTGAGSAIKKIAMSLFLPKVLFSMGGELAHTLVSSRIDRVVTSMFDVAKVRDAVKSGNTEALDDIAEFIEDAFGGGMEQARSGGGLGSRAGDDSLDVVNDGNAFERFGRKASNLTAQGSLMSPATMWMRSVVARSEARRIIAKAKAGKTMFRSANVAKRWGVDEEMQGRILSELRRISKVKSELTGAQVWDTSFSSWQDREALEAFKGYLVRKAQSGIQEVNPGETPSFFKNGFQSVLWQFFSFTTGAANNWQRNAVAALNPFSGRDMATRMHDLRTLGIAAIGAISMSYIKWAYQIAEMDDPKKREEAVEKLDHNAIMKGILYTPQVGMIPQGVDVLNGLIPMTDPIFASQRNSGLSGLAGTPWTSSPAGEIPNRIFRAIQAPANIAAGASGMKEDVDFEKELEAIQRAIPGAGLLAFDHYLNAAIEAAPSPDDE